jgi:Flp pilus assembly protein TadB
VNRYSDLRASDADRDEVVSRLHRAATEGRISSEELEHRISSVLRSRTYGELQAAVSDLPGPARRRSRQRPERRVAGWAFSAVRANPMLIVFMIPVLAVTLAMVLAATVMWTVLTVVALILSGRAGHGPLGHWVRGGLYAGRRIRHTTPSSS